MERDPFAIRAGALRETLICADPPGGAVSVDTWRTSAGSAAKATWIRAAR
jgi:hypothetical protein